MQHIFYFRTPAGLRQMHAAASTLSQRERQIMLLCSGQRPLSVLLELFGDPVIRELHQLTVDGHLQARYQPPEAVSLPPASALDQADGGVDPPGLVHTRLVQTRDFATLVARSLDSRPAHALADRFAAAVQADDVLQYAASLIGLLFQAGDLNRAERVGYKLADLLPRGMVPQMIDRLLDGPNPQLAAALYEHLLSDRELPGTEHASMR